VTPKGRPANLSIDTVILTVLNGDPSASVPDIAQEAKVSSSTVFYALTTHMGYIYQRGLLMLHNLSEPQKIDRLRQSHELLEILQDAKGLRCRFILTEYESWFLFMNEHRKLWLRPDSEVPEVARRLINTPQMTITLF
jgi:hypothetical protein